MNTSHPSFTGLSDIAQKYSGILSDVWGVIHNGERIHVEACDALIKYREQGGRVVLITNSPKPSHYVIEQMNQLGVSREVYDDIVSSGDATRNLLENYRNKTVVRIGGEQDKTLFDGMDLKFGDAQEASAVVVSDLENDDDRPENYLYQIPHWLERKLPLICANPDKIVEIGDRLVYCGGALADLYEDMGGQSLMAGKPYAPIYDLAKSLLDEASGVSAPKHKILAIGDSVRTDAVGAAQFGIDLLFITGSIHAHELDAFNNPDPQRIRDFVGVSRANMVGFMPRLAW